MNKDIEKIRAEVKRRREIHRKAKRIVSAFEDNAILCYIDSMQEEPKECMYSKDNYTDEDRKVLCDGCEEGCKYNKKGTVNDKLGGINTALVQDKLIWQNNIKHDCSFCSMPDCVSRNSSAKDNCLLNRKKEPSIPDIVDEHFDEMFDKEYTNKDLKKAAEEYSFNIPSEIFYDLSPVLQNIWKHEIGDAFKDGAQWQTQQMMKGATEVTVHVEAGNYPYIPQIELYDYDKDVPLAKEGDKYKVILIKED